VNKFKSFSLFLLLLAFPFFTFADIAVVPNILEFKAEDLPRADVIVSNKGNQDDYVKVVPYAVVDPGTTKEHNVVIRNPEQGGLLVTPQRLVIPPHQQRSIRFMLTEVAPTKDKIYRVDVTPVAQQLLPNYHFKQGGKTIGVQILIGYGILAIVRPVHPHGEVELHREGKTLFLHNVGNTNVLASVNSQCIDKHCTPVNKSTRLYADNRWQIELPYSAPAKVSISFMEEENTLISN
jgi:P pilus assembly chaperone PapD